MFKPSIQNPSIVDSEEFPNVINAPCSIAITVDAPAEWFENNPTDSQDQAVQQIIGDLQDDLWQFVARARMMRETSGQNGQRLVSRWPNLTAELTYNFGQEMLRLTVAPSNEPSGEELSITTYGLKKVKVKFTAFPLPGASHNGGEPPTPQLKKPANPSPMGLAYETADPDTMIYYGSDSGPLNMYTYKPDKPGATSKKNSEGIYTSNDGAAEPTDKRTIFKVLGSAVLTMPIKGKAYWEVKITKLPTAVPKDITVPLPQSYRTGSTGITLNGPEWIGCTVTSEFFSISADGFSYTWPKKLNTFNSPQIGIGDDTFLPDDLVASPPSEVELYQDYGPTLDGTGVYVTRRTIMESSVTCRGFDQAGLTSTLAGQGRMVARPPDGISPWLNITINWSATQQGNLISSAGEYYQGPFFATSSVDGFAPPAGPWADQAAANPGHLYYAATLDTSVTSKDAPISGPPPGMRLNTAIEAHLTADFVWQGMGFRYLGTAGDFYIPNPYGFSLTNSTLYPSTTFHDWSTTTGWAWSRQFIDSASTSGTYTEYHYTIPANTTYLQVPTDNTLANILAELPPPEPGSGGIGGSVFEGSVTDATYTEIFDNTTWTLQNSTGAVEATTTVSPPAAIPALADTTYTNYPAVTVQLGDWMPSELGGSPMTWPANASGSFIYASLTFYGTAMVNLSPSSWYATFQWSYSDPWQKLMTPGEHAPVFNGAGAPGSKAGPGDDDPLTYYTGVDFGSLKEGDVIMFAVDADQGLAWIGYNGKWRNIDGEVTSAQIGRGEKFTAVIRGGYYDLKYVQGSDPGPDFKPPKIYPVIAWNVGPLEAEFHYGVGNKYGPPSGFKFYGAKTTTV